MSEPVSARRERQFSDLLDHHKRLILKVALTYGRTQEDRNDLSQEIIIQLWRAYPSFDESKPFSTWMYRIALNVAISHARKIWWREDQTVAFAELELEPAIAPVPEADERLHALREFIHELDDMNKALVLLYLDEKTHQEIAEIMGISASNVGTKISRLKQRLRNRFNEVNNQ